MNIQRRVIRIDSPQVQQGFLGPGHIARKIIGSDYGMTDPFIAMMDDMLDKTDDTPAGGAHPHGGFDTVSLLIEGELGDEPHQLKQGDFQIMTAGNGVIHSEAMNGNIKMRLMQMWLNLPEDLRWTHPRVQDLSLNGAPKVSENGVKITVYSGSLSGVVSPVLNYVPLIVADFNMQQGAYTLQNIPASFTTFIYVLEGSVTAGSDGKTIHQNQVGWLAG